MGGGNGNVIYVRTDGVCTRYWITSLSRQSDDGERNLLSLATAELCFHVTRRRGSIFPWKIRRDGFDDTNFYLFRKLTNSGGSSRLMKFVVFFFVICCWSY